MIMKVIKQKHHRVLVKVFGYVGEVGANCHSRVPIHSCVHVINNPNFEATNSTKRDAYFEGAFLQVRCKNIFLLRDDLAKGLSTIIMVLEIIKSRLFTPEVNPEHI